MFAKITNGSVELFPYSMGDLRRDNPNTSFPRYVSAETMAEYWVFEVTENLCMHAHAHLKVGFVDPAEQLLAQGVGDGLDLLDQRLGRRAQQDFFRPAVFHYRLAAYQALGFQAVEQAGQGRAFYTHALGQLALGWRLVEARQVQQHQPTRLGQVEPGQAAVQFGAPAPGHLGQLHAEAVLVVSQGHKQLNEQN